MQISDLGSGNRLATLRGNVASGFVVVSESNAIEIEFSSDRSVFYSGFSLTVSQTDDGSFKTLCDVVSLSTLTSTLYTVHTRAIVSN